MFRMPKYRPESSPVEALSVVGERRPCSRRRLADEGVLADVSSTADRGFWESRRYELGLLLDMRFTSTPRKAAGAQHATDHGLYG
jgi:hypothetical protein